MASSAGLSAVIVAIALAATILRPNHAIHAMPAFDTRAAGWYRTGVMYAIIETGGKQYRVAEGDVIRCDVAGDAGSDVTFDRVVLAGGGKSVSVGSPLVSGATVSGTVLRRGRDKKILVFHYKPKKRVRKLSGHRRHFAEVRITKISVA